MHWWCQQMWLPAANPFLSYRKCVMYTFSTQSLCNTIKQIHHWKIKFTMYSNNNYWYYNQNGLLLKLLLFLKPFFVRMAVMSTTRDEGMHSGTVYSSPNITTLWPLAVGSSQRDRNSAILLKLKKKVKVNKTQTKQ